MILESLKVLPLMVVSVWLLPAPVAAYSAVASTGSDDSDGPRIFKALNMDLVFPKTFNVSDGTSTTARSRPQSTDPTLFVTPSITPETPHSAEPFAEASTLVTPPTYASTGRAVDYRPAYQLGQLLTPLMKTPPKQPSTYGGGARPHVVYSQSPYGPQSSPSRAELNKLRGTGSSFSDRFTPGEAVASSQFLKGGKHHHHHHPPPSSSNGQGGKVSASTNIVESYVPPKDLYAFPPNIYAQYPAPAKGQRPAINETVNSYSPPASGPQLSNVAYPLATAGSDNNGYKYAGPVNLDYLPPSSSKDPTKEMLSASNAGDGGDVDDGDDSIGVLPASAMDALDDNANGAPGADDAMPNSNAMAGAGMSPDDHDHDHDHHHDHGHPITGYDDDKEYPTPPPGWLEEHPEAGHDPPDHHHHHDDHHFDLHDHFPIHPHYPEVIYDHYPHHHHVEPPPTLPPPVTTPEPPPPAPPPEPRVKKYSYFYIGRKLWYIPLYFTVWFSFYVLWLIVKSIARHKVNLPNHYVSRRSVSTTDYDRMAEEYINELTVSVLEGIDTFQRKHGL